jgi:parallel beta-helix repeat protein
MIQRNVTPWRSTVSLAILFVVCVLSIGTNAAALSSVGGNVLVNNPAQDTGGGSHQQQETTVAVNPTTGTICAVYNDTYEFFHGNGFTGFSRSTNGGVSFDDRGALGPLPSGDGENDGDPSVVFRRSDGRFYATTVLEIGVGIWTSTDDCASFTFSAFVHRCSLSGDCDDKDMMTVDNNPASPHYGRLYVGFADGSLDTPNPPLHATERIQAITYSDDGTTWSTPVQLSDSGFFNNARGSWPAIAPNGDVYVSWDLINGAAGTFDIQLARSTDGGAHFTRLPNPVTGAVQPFDAAATAACPLPALNGNIRYAPFTQLAVGSDGCLHMVYSFAPNTSHTGDVSDVYYNRSCNQGSTWGPQVKINDDGTATDQFLPNLSVGPTNLVSVAWYDRRNDPSNLQYDLYTRESVDGGLTFAPSARVTTSSSPIYVDNTSPLAACNFTDYDQQAQVRGAVYLLWSDARNVQDGHPDNDVKFQNINPGNGLCGSLVVAPCSATVAGVSGTFSSVQAAVNAAPNGGTVTVSGRCNEHVSVVGRSGLTIQGVPPAGGCGASGPAPGDLSSTISGGIDVVLSALNIQIKYLNLVDASASGLNVDASVVSAGTCNCLARNGSQGLRISGVGLTTVTQTLIQNNPLGVFVQGSNTVNLDHNTVVKNTGDGISTLATTASLITSSTVQNNSGRGVVLTSSAGNFVNGNTISGNGDGLVNQVNCVLSAGNLGNDIPLLCL